MNKLRGIAEHVSAHASRPFLIDAVSGRAWSYGEFDRLSRDLAFRLWQLGLRRGERTLILLDNCPEFAALYFACLHLGAVAVPINPSLHRGDVDFLATHCGASLLVRSDGTNGSISPSAAETFERTLWIDSPDDRLAGRTYWSIEDGPLPESTDFRPMLDVDDRDPWTITFTSGTTSRPKGVTHRISSLLASAAAFNRSVGYTQSTRLYHMLPMAYMAGLLNTILCPFLAGGCIILDRPFDARLAMDFWRTPIRYQVNRLCLAPTMLSTILHLDRSAWGPEFSRKHIEAVSVCTAPLPASVKSGFESRYGAPALESYGLSETLFVSTNAAGDDRPGSVGRLIDGVAIDVRDDDGKRLGPGESGEIFVHAPTNMIGYLDPATAQPDPLTAPDWFATGDVGHADADGFVFITGRKKDLIIRGGVNVSPRAVEEAILSHPGVRDVAVVGLPHELFGEEVVAVVAPATRGDWDSLRESLASHCREKLAETCRPSRFFEMPSLPRSSTGKVQKSNLRSMLMHAIPAGAVA